MQLLDEQMEEFSRGIAGEAPGILPGLRGQHESFQELLKHNLNRTDLKPFPLTMTILTAMSGARPTTS